MHPIHFPVRRLDRSAPTRELLSPEERKPERTGLLWDLLYRFYDGDGSPLYIGITSADATRWHQHRKTAEWWPMAEHVAVSVYASTQDARSAERAAIRAEQPRFNKQDVRWPASTTVRFDGTPKEAAAHLHRVAHPDFVQDLAALLATPNAFPQAIPPPLPDFGTAEQRAGHHRPPASPMP